MTTLQKVQEIAERYDFEFVKQKKNTLFMRRGEETLLLSAEGVRYDSHIRYSPDLLDTREAEWPMRVVESDEFETLFANTVGI